MIVPNKRAMGLLLAALCVLSLCAATARAEELPAAEAYCFSGEEFAAEGEQTPDGVYISTVPDVEVGELRLGTRVIRAGDVLPRERLGELVFRPTDDENAEAEICFRGIGDGALLEAGSFRMQIRSTKNAAPKAEDLDFETYRDLPNEGQLHASDAEGDPLCFALADAPRSGSVELREDGCFTYTPKRNKLGEDRFTFVVSDTAGNVSEPACVRFTICKPQEAKTFADLDDSAQFPALWLREQGLYSGVTVTGRLCFCPEQTVSRGEFLAMAMKLAGIEPEYNALHSGFADEDESPVWLRPYLIAAVRGGIARGVQTDQGLAFRPNEAIKAAEAAAILCRCFRLEQAQPVGAMDGEEALPAWAAQAVASLEQYGISLPDDRQAALDRWETATLLYAVSARVT